MRRVLSALAVVWVLATALLFVGNASAAPYPPVTHPSLSVSTTTPCVGQAIEVGGTNFAAGETIKLSVGGQPVGTATTGATGSFDPSVNTPSLVGKQDLTGLGATSGREASLMLTIRNCSGVSGESTSSGGLAFTGVEIAGLCVAAAVFIGCGAFFVAAGRRRNSAVGA
jgi:hypothetical protein